MEDFIATGQKGKTDFFSYILTISLTASVLILSSNLGLILYAFQTGSETVSVSKLALHFGKNGFFFLQLLPVALSLLTLLTCVKYIHRRSRKSVMTTRPSFDFKRLFFSAFLWGSILLTFLGISYFSEPKSIQWNYAGNSFWILLVISLVFVSLQTLFEEVLFRAYLLQAFGGIFKKKWILILISSLIFMAMHLNNPEVKLMGLSAYVYYFVTALFLATLVVADHGIELAVGFHMINNLFGSVVLTNNWQVFQTDALLLNNAPAELNWAHVLTMLVIYPFLLYFYTRKYKLSLRTIF